MKIGISTGTLFPEKTESCVKKLAKLGVKNIELFFNTESELNVEFILKLKTIIDEYGINVVSIHPYTSVIETFYFFSMNDYKLEDSVKFYEKYFFACNILGAKYVVFHGCFITSEYMNMQRYVTNINKLVSKAREYDVYISQENVVKYKCGYIENLKYLKEHTDENLKFTFDIKQAIRAKQDIYEILDVMKDRLSHVHISDFDDENDSLIPGTGKFDYEKFFKYLKENTTAEAGLIEIYKNRYNHIDQVMKSMDYLCNISK